MIDWLNQNAGALNAILTLIYVAATLIILGIMVRANTLTRKGIQLAADLEIERSRPIIIVDMFPVSFAQHLSVKNIGATPAYDVSFVIDPVPMSIRGVCRDKPNPANEWVPIAFLKNGIKFLSPNREIKSCMAPLCELGAKYDTLVFKGEVSYRDGAGREYSDIIDIDLGFLEGTANYRPKEVGAELEKLNRTMNKFFTDQFSPLIQTIHDDELRARKVKEHEAHKKSLEKVDGDRGADQGVGEGVVKGSVLEREGQGVSS